MKLKSKFRRFERKWREEGITEAIRAAITYTASRVIPPVIRPIYQPPSIYLHSRYARKNNIFAEDWDLLIVLDTCRVDALKMLSDEYAFVSDVESRWSVGGSSPEWITNTFSRQFKDEVSETAYVTSNPHAVTVLEEQFERHYLEGHLKPDHKRINRYSISKPAHPSDFHSYISLYDRSIEFDKVENPYPDPREVTDHAIQLGRTSSPNRIVLHYMPPHVPYIAYQDGDEIRIGAQRSTSFEAYLDNLRWALNEVELLLQNIDRERVVITADHGENFRLRSIRAEHNPGMVTPTVRRVPWVETTAKDTGEREPDVSQSDRSDLKSTLEALGYR